MAFQSIQNSEIAVGASIDNSLLVKIKNNDDALNAKDGLIDVKDSAQDTSIASLQSQITTLSTALGLVTSKANPGYLKIGGLIIQFGTGSQNDATIITYSLPIAYPSNHVAIVVTQSNSGGADPYANGLKVVSQSTTGFTVRALCNVSPVTFNWISIGY